MAMRDGFPFLIEGVQGSLAVDSLRRVPLVDTPSEEWLQEILDKAPGILPIQEID